MSWIKVRTDLIRSPEVLLMAETLDIQEEFVVGLLCSAWAMADASACEDGRIERGTKRMIDRCVSFPGFADAMETAGWLVVEDGAIVFPDYQEHNGSTAKTRAQTNKRVARKRKRDAAVTEEKRTGVTETIPEKKREEEIRGEEKREEVSCEVRSGEDHKSKEGGVGGESDAGQADGASAPDGKHAGSEAPTKKLDAQKVLGMASYLFGAEGEKRGRLNITKLPGFDPKQDRTTLLKLAACRVAGTVSEDWVADACEGLRKRLGEKDMGRLDRPVNYFCRILIETGPAKLGGRTFNQVMAEIAERVPGELLRPPGE